MDYDNIFDRDINEKFFYTDYPGNKMMVGKINLRNAMARLSKNEYYVLVTYDKSERLPEQYIPLTNLKSEDGTLFATFNPNTRFWSICRDGGIQRISRIGDLSTGSPNYLLGPGPDTISLEDLITEQYDAYLKSQSNSVTQGR